MTSVSTVGTMNELTEGCGGREGAASQVRVGSKSVVSVNIPKPSQFFLYFCLRSLPFLMLLAEQMERYCVLWFDTSITFLEGTALLSYQKQQRREKEPGSLHLWSHVYGRCLFIYLNLFIQPKKSSVSWAGWESGVADRTKVGRVFSQGAAWEMKERKS